MRQLEAGIQQISDGLEVLLNNIFLITSQPLASNIKTVMNQSAQKTFALKF